jgi:hypothetical protein
MRKTRSIVGALSVAVAVLSSGCGSSSGEPRSSTSAGAGGGTAGAADGVSGSSVDASGGSQTASGGASEDGGAAGAPSNLYIDELRTNNPDACLPRELPFGATGGPNEGRVACAIAELHFDACDCEQPGRAALSDALLTAVVGHAEQLGSCGGASGVACDSACGCELVQLAGTAVDTSSELYACQNELTPAQDLAGFCVIDQERMEGGGPAPIGDHAIVADCPASTQRRIRFLGQDLPSASATVFIACTGSTPSF